MPHKTREDNLAYYKTWYHRNIAHVKQYQADHAEHKKEYNRHYREENRDRLSEAQRTPKAKAASIERQKRYVNRHPERVAARLRAYKVQNRSLFRLHENKRRARKEGGNANLSQEQWEAIVRFYDGRCAYCGIRPNSLTVDHVVPLSKGGAHDISNIVPACKPCNNSKYNKEPLVPVRTLLL